MNKRPLFSRSTHFRELHWQTHPVAGLGGSGSDTDVSLSQGHVLTWVQPGMKLGGRLKTQAFQPEAGRLRWTPLVSGLLARLAEALAGLHHDPASPPVQSSHFCLPFTGDGSP